MFLHYNNFCDIFCSFSWCLATASFSGMGCKEISYEKIGKQKLLSKHLLRLNNTRKWPQNGIKAVIYGFNDV